MADFLALIVRASPVRTVPEVASRQLIFVDLDSFAVSCVAID